MTTIRTVSLALVLTFIGSVALSAQSSSGVGRPLTADDYKQLRSLQDIQVSPDGKTVLLKIGIVDTVTDAYTSDLWTLDSSSGALRLFTDGKGGGYHARFSPDGARVAFIASRDDTARVYAQALAGGGELRLFTFAGDIDEFAWFPDGRHVAFVAKDPEPSDSATAREHVRQYTRTYFTVNGEGFLDGRYSHLWVADLTTGRARMIGGGDYDYTAPAVSPDGRLIAFSSNRTADRDRNRNSDIWVTPADSGALVQVSHEAGTADNPRWSPDGKSLAYQEQVVANNYGSHAYLWVTSIDAGQGDAVPGAPRNLTATMDKSIAEGSYDEGGATYPTWSRDGRSLYVGLEDRGRVTAWAIPSVGGAPRLLLGGDVMIEYLSPSPSGFVYGMADGTHLSDVYTIDRAGGQQRQLTHLNDDWFREVAVLPTESMVFRSRDGTTVEGFVVKPAGFEDGHRYPTVLGIHGGPQWFYPVSYHMQFQIAAGRGYLAVYINPRGSTSYGTKFLERINGRYAHGDDQDFMTALDTVITRGWADPDNLFLMGNSYGGIATDWLITQTNRFRAAASSSGVADYTASFGVDDDPIEWLADMGGAPWQVPEKYRVQSAMTYVNRVVTPTIFLHGDEDHICPVGESERMYLALRLLGIDSKLVIFPGENHNFDARASSYPVRTRLIFDWFDAHRSR
ncbi:MAG: S9 family peptidase [Gemmatimonadota bacterium]